MTAFGDLPSRSSADYAGAVTGLRTSLAEIKFDYVANLDLTVEFGSGDVTGAISDFVTNLASFENPEGEVPISGSIFNDGGAAGI